MRAKKRKDSEEDNDYQPEVGNAVISILKILLSKYLCLVSISIHHCLKKSMPQKLKQAIFSGLV